jgi:membrane protease subunit HflC
MKKGNVFALVVVLLLIGLSSMSFYIVYEDEVAVVKTLSEIKKIVISSQDHDMVMQNFEVNGTTNVEILQEKGLHFKIPLIQTVEKYTSKYLTYVSLPELVNTNDGRRIEIQMYAQYRIMDPVTYKNVVQTVSNANRKIDDTVYPVVIQSANNLVFDDFFKGSILEDLINEKKDALNQDLVSKFGLYVSDIGINRKTFPASNIESIESKMSLQIEKESELLIAEGDAYYLSEQASTDREKAEIIAKAVEEAAVTRAVADAEAVRIYQESLQKDISFYEFTKRMEIYSKMTDSTLFLDSNNDLVRFINGYDN